MKNQLKNNDYNKGFGSNDRILHESDKSEITSWGFQDRSRYENLTLLASGKVYTHNVDGYYFISKKAGKQNAYVSMYSDYIGFTSASPNAEGNCVLTMRTPAGHGCIVNYDAIGEVNQFRFVYAKGAKNE